MTLDDFLPPQTGEHTATRTNLAGKPVTLDSIRDLMESLPGALPPHDSPPRWADDEDVFRLPVRDVLVVHPDDLPLVPSIVIDRLSNLGVAVEACGFLQSGIWLVMGNVARAMHAIKTEQAVEAAMRENQVFLRLLKRNGLL